MRDWLPQVLGAAGVVAALMGGIAWQLSLHDQSEVLHDIQRRLAHVEANQRWMMERMPGAGRVPQAAAAFECAADTGGE